MSEVFSDVRINQYMMQSFVTEVNRFGLLVPSTLHISLELNNNHEFAIHHNMDDMPLL